MANAPVTSSTAYTEKIHENICTAVTSNGIKYPQSCRILVYDAYKYKCLTSLNKLIS